MALIRRVISGSTIIFQQFIRAHHAAHHAVTGHHVRGSPALAIFKRVSYFSGRVIRVCAPLFVIGFIFTFTHGGLTGIFLGNVAVDLPLSDTYFVVAHFHMVMGVSPILVVFGSIYHWYPKITGRMFNEALGRWHFWMTFLGLYAVYLPMHYLGFQGVPRRYFAMGDTEFMPDSAFALNQSITISAIFVAATQLLFLYNIFASLKNGKKAGGNPWKATSLEWQTPDTPPKHGNWGHNLPEVHRWAYDYSVPGYHDDFIPQNVPDDSAPTSSEYGADDSDESGTTS